MMKVKNIIIFSLAFVLVMPGFAAANGNVPQTKVGQQDKPCDCHEGMHKHHHMMNKDWQAKMAEREQKLLNWVNQYTPDKKAEWASVFNERKDLRNQWMSPENAEKREKWKKEKMAKMQELKKQYDEGEITKEEFLKQAHGGKNMGNWKTFDDLSAAVEKKDDKQAAALLNKMLEQYKQYNEKMKEILKG